MIIMMGEEDDDDRPWQADYHLAERACGDDEDATTLMMIR